MEKLMKLLNKKLIVLMLLSLAVTACKKPEQAKDTPVEVSKEQKVEQKVETAPSPIEATEATSPTIALWAQSLKYGTMMSVQTTHPNLSAEQKTCLLSADADIIYLEKGKSEVTQALGEEGLKVSDEFYSSEVGKKVQAYAKQQLQQMMGEPVTGAPITLSAEDEKAVMDFMQSDVAKKVQAQAEGTDAAKMDAMMKELAAQEALRCGISAEGTKAEGTSAS